MKKDRLELMLEKRVAMLEAELSDVESSANDEVLHNEMIDELNQMIRSFTTKLNSQIGNPNSDKAVKKTKSFKLIKKLKEAWVDSARK